MKRLNCAALLIFVGMLIPAVALSQTVNLTASNISVGGGKLVSGQLCAVPVDNSNHPLTASALGGTAGGALTTEAACAVVTNGALAGGYTLPDTALTRPLNVCLRITITDSNQNGKAVYTAPCVQPASSGPAVTGPQAWCTVSGATTCNFDKYAPSIPAQVLVGNGINDPGANGVMKRIAPNTTAPAMFVDIVALWASGSCTSGYLKFDGSCSTPAGSGGMVFPSAGLGASTGAAWRTPVFSDVVALWASGSCTSGYLKFDGSCSTPSGSMVYPSAGLGVSTGAAWRTPAFSDVVNLWASGSCTSGYLKYDGSCSTPAGGTTYTAGQGVSTGGNVLSTTSVTTSQIPFSNQNSLTSAMQLVVAPTSFAYTIPTNGTITGSTTMRNGTSQVLLQTLPTATWTVTLYKYPASTAGCLASAPSSIGTVAVATSGAQTWAVTQTSFAVGDCLVIVAPAVVDTSASGVYGVIAVID